MTSVWWLAACLYIASAFALQQAPTLSAERSVIIGRVDRLERAVAAGGHAAIDACLDVCHALPGASGAATIPSCAAELNEAAAFFDWDHGDSLGQHLFNAELWDDAVEALALAGSSSDERLLLDAAAAIAASARFLLLTPSQRTDVLQTLRETISSDAFLFTRRAALAAWKERRAAPVSVADAFAAARQRRKKQDYVAVAPAVDDDSRVIQALYACSLKHLGPSLLEPLGFPSSKLGLRSFVAAARRTGSQAEAAALGQIWHASDGLGPLIVPNLSSADAASRTLVIVFSSLGWHGVVRAEWGATLRAAGEESIVVAHALDTSQSWFLTNPIDGEYDDGSWWDRQLDEMCRSYGRVCILGESMGATAALRYARHATTAVVALVPQIDVRDFEYSGRADFSFERKAQLKAAIQQSCQEMTARLVLHVGQDPPDLRQLDYLPDEVMDKATVVKHDVAGHALGAGLKAQGLLRKTVLRDLLGHSYMLPPADTSAVLCPRMATGILGSPPYADRQSTAS